MPERFDWHPEPELIDVRDPARARAALENLGERTWTEALDWLYDHAMTRPTAPDLYPEMRAAYYGAPGGPGPAPARGATSTEVLAEFRDRVAPMTFNAQHPGVQLLHAAAAPDVDRRRGARAVDPSRRGCVACGPWRRRSSKRR